MGILNDLKKLFFGASSVAKSASEKTGKYIHEEADELYDKAKDAADRTGERVSKSAEGLRESIKRNSEDLRERAEKKWDEISESPMVKKAADTSEKVGERILEEGGEMFDKGKDLSEDVGERVLKAKDDIVKRAKEVADRAGDKLSETMDKAERWAEEESKKPKKDFADDDLDIGESLLDESDDFFSKASKYAEGDYGAFSEGKITISGKEHSKSSDPLKKERATGFEDLDGDGNEIIDDAILDSSEEKAAGKSGEEE